MKNRLVRWSLVLLALAWAAPAAALKDVEVPKAFKKDYDAAVKLQAAAKYEQALAAFEALPPPAQTALTILHEAHCKRHLGRWLEAIRDYESIAQDPELDEATREMAASDLQEARAHVPRLSVGLDGHAGGVEVRVGERTVTPPTTLELDPGTYEVVASRKGQIVFRRTIVAEVDRSAEILIHVAPEVTTPTATSGRTPPESGRTDQVAAGPSALPYVSFGVGALFAGVAIGSYAAATSAASRFTSSCDRPEGCDESHAQATRTWNAVTAVGIGGAVIAAGTGITLLLLRPASPVQARVATSPTGASLILTASF